MLEVIRSVMYRSLWPSQTIVAAALFAHGPLSPATFIRKPLPAPLRCDAGPAAGLPVDSHRQRAEQLPLLDPL
ncbi:hypothetical protein J6590_106745 [Homalodisca vitripennis]|nr:hypothetical protein J6590_018918 [Homalodisca vitripennis]KAG8308568.1 hypothetical protein J6590_106745 [Homalodisca vitripennis]